MQCISKFNNVISFLLCVIDRFSKYAWVVPLKDKEGVLLVQNNEIMDIILKFIQHTMAENLLLLKDLLEI